MPILPFLLTIFSGLYSTCKNHYHLDSGHYAFALNKFDLTLQHPHPTGYTQQKILASSYIQQSMVKTRPRNGQYFDQETYGSYRKIMMNRNLMEPGIYEQMRAVEDSHWWFVARRSIIETVIASLQLTPNARILDVGSGTGGNLAMLSRFGSVTGIEADEMALSLCASRKAATVLKGSLPSGLPDFTQKFDLIIMLDVLEHIDDDLASLKSLERLLSPNGVIIITVPAFPFLWSDHDVQHHHKRRYKCSTLAKLFKKSGLGIQHLTYFNTWLFPFIAVVRLIRKFYPSRVTGQDIQVPPLLVNRLLGMLFRSEKRLVTHLKLPFGTSILAIAMKNNE